jgi:hypothetical protein
VDPTAQSESNRLRNILALILGISLSLGIAFGRLLLHAGLESLLLRNAILFPFTYGAFFFCVHIWRISTRKGSGTDPSAKESENQSVSNLDSVQAGADSSDSKGWGWPTGLNLDFGEATLIVLAVLAVIALIWVTGWVFGEASSILAEALFDVGLTTSLARAARMRPGSPWYVGLFRKTIGPFLVFYCSSAILLLLAHESCPAQPTLFKIVRECWMSRV